VSDEANRLSGITVQFHYLGLEPVVGAPLVREEGAGTPEEKLSARCTQLSDACINVKSAMAVYLGERYPDNARDAAVQRNAIEMRLARVITAVFEELGQATT